LSLSFEAKKCRRFSRDVEILRPTQHEEDCICSCWLGVGRASFCGWKTKLATMRLPLRSQNSIADNSIQHRKPTRVFGEAVMVVNRSKQIHRDLLPNANMHVEKEQNAKMPSYVTVHSRNDCLIFAPFPRRPAGALLSPAVSAKTRPIRCCDGASLLLSRLADHCCGSFILLYWKPFVAVGRDFINCLDFI